MDNGLGRSSPARGGVGIARGVSPESRHEPRVKPPTAAATSMADRPKARPCRVLGRSAMEAYREACSTNFASVDPAGPSAFGGRLSPLELVAQVGAAGVLGNGDGQECFRFESKTELPRQTGHLEGIAERLVPLVEFLIPSLEPFDSRFSGRRSSTPRSTRPALSASSASLVSAETSPGSA